MQAETGITVAGGDGPNDADVSRAPEANANLCEMLAREADHFVDVAMGRAPPTMQRSRLRPREAAKVSIALIHAHQIARTSFNYTMISALEAATPLSRR